jgi:glucose-1-phosphate cytidylyltransferase
VREHLGNETFCMTYGDGVSNVDITKTIEFHKTKGKLATLTATQPPGRFGVINLHNPSEEGAHVSGFAEKPKGDGAWINAGYFVLEPDVLDLIGDDSTIWEKEPMQKLADGDQLVAYQHEGFWHPMDTLRDKHFLEDLWVNGAAPWKIW